MSKPVKTVQKELLVQKNENGSKAPFVAFLILFVCVILIVVWANKDKINWGESLLAKKEKADTLVCPFTYRNSRVDLCSTVAQSGTYPIMLMHRNAQAKLHYDNGASGLIRSFDTFNNNWQGILIKAGSNGNYKITYGSSAQLVGFQTGIGNRIQMAPTDADYQATEPLRTQYLSINTDGTFKASVSKTKLITEWKITVDPTNTDYIIITVPDATTTGTDMKKFVGGELAMPYFDEGGNGYMEVAPWMRDNKMSRYYDPLIVRGPAGVTPAHPASFTKGATNHHWVLDSVSH